MPTPLILSYAKKAKKPVHEVEAAWNKAKEDAKGIRRSNIVDKDYWKLVNGLVKKSLGLHEETEMKLSFKEFVAEDVKEVWYTLAMDGRGLGKVLGYLESDTESEAKKLDRTGELCDALDLFKGQDIPDWFETEVISKSDFDKSYGGRMPLKNKGK